MREIIFRDSTIREGIETPLRALDHNQKLEIAKRLEEVGVQEIEIQSPNHIEDTLKIGEMIKEAGIHLTTTGFVFQWTDKEIVKQQVEVLKDVIDRFIIVVPGSEVNLKLRNTTIHKMRRDIEYLLNLLAKENKEFELGIMDIYQMEDIPFSELIIPYKDVIGKYALYDTSGRATPDKVVKKVQILKDIAPNSRVLVHGHDDFGLAVINSISGIINGADGCDVVVNGLGDRSGNASFEEIVLALETLYKIKTPIQLEKINDLCQFVYDSFKFEVPDIKPIVGKNSFCHATDMHIHGVYLGAADAYEPFDVHRIGGQRTFTFLEENYKCSLAAILKKYGQEVTEVNMRKLFDELQGQSKVKGRIIESEMDQIVRKLFNKNNLVRFCDR